MGDPRIILGPLDNTNAFNDFNDGTAQANQIGSTSDCFEETLALECGFGSVQDITAEDYVDKMSSIYRSRRGCKENDNCNILKALTDKVIRAKDCEFLEACCDRLKGVRGLARTRKMIKKAIKSKPKENICQYLAEFADSRLDMPSQPVRLNQDQLCMKGEPCEVNDESSSPRSQTNNRGTFNDLGIQTGDTRVLDRLQQPSSPINGSSRSENCDISQITDPNIGYDHYPAMDTASYRNLEQVFACLPKSNDTFALDNGPAALQHNATSAPMSNDIPPNPMGYGYPSDASPNISPGPTPPPPILTSPWSNHFYFSTSYSAMHSFAPPTKPLPGAIPLPPPAHLPVPNLPCGSPMCAYGCCPPLPPLLPGMPIFANKQLVGFSPFPNGMIQLPPRQYQDGRPTMQPFFPEMPADFPVPEPGHGCNIVQHQPVLAYNAINCHEMNNNMAVSNGNLRYNSHPRPFPGRNNNGVPNSDMAYQQPPALNDAVVLPDAAASHEFFPQSTATSTNAPMDQLQSQGQDQMEPLFLTLTKDKNNSLAGTVDGDIRSQAEKNHLPCKPHTLWGRRNKQPPRTAIPESPQQLELALEPSTKCPNQAETVPPSMNSAATGRKDDRRELPGKRVPSQSPLYLAVLNALKLESKNKAQDAPSSEQPSPKTEKPCTESGAPRDSDDSSNAPGEQEQKLCSPINGSSYDAERQKAGGEEHCAIFRTTFRGVKYISGTKHSRVSRIRLYTEAYIKIPLGYDGDIVVKGTPDAVSEALVEMERLMRKIDVPYEVVSLNNACKSYSKSSSNMLSTRVLYRRKQQASA